jgi:hypothetical protein
MTSKSIPWYRQFREKYVHAIKFLFSFYVWNFQNNPSSDALKTYEKETLARFIFESNNIEGEGLSLGETNELIIDEFENDDSISSISTNPVFDHRFIKWKNSL